jgi:hypothetical protein
MDLKKIFLYRSFPVNMSHSMELSLFGYAGSACSFRTTLSIPFVNVLYLLCRSVTAKRNFPYWLSTTMLL